MSLTDILSLDVGGTLFRSSRATLLQSPGSMLSKMFDPSLPLSPGVLCTEKNTYFIDRDPQYFRVILNYLRTGKLVMDHDCSADGILTEARYFGVTEIERSLAGSAQELVLNVGGTVFSTTRDTLCCFPGSSLNSMVEGDDVPLRDKHGNIFIDEDPSDFVFVLKALRSYRHSTRHFLCFSHGQGDRYEDAYDPVKVPSGQLESVESLASRLGLPKTTEELVCTFRQNTNTSSNTKESGNTNSKECANKWNRVAELFTRDDGYLGIYRPKVADMAELPSETNGVS